MSQFENWSQSHTDKTSDAKFDPLFTSVAPDMQNYRSQFHKSCQSASEELVASNVLPGLSLDGLNSSESAQPSESNQVSSELTQFRQDLRTLFVDLSELLTGQPPGAATASDMGADSSISPATIGASNDASAAPPLPNTGSGEAAAGTPNTGSGEAAAGTPNTGSGEAAAGTPNTGSGEAAAGTPNSGSGEAAAGTPNTGSAEAAAGNPSPASAGNAGFIGFFGGDTNAAEADSISSALGKNVVPASYLDWRQPAAQTTQYNIGQYSSWVAANPGEGMILGVPLTYDGQSLASTASGANNSEFTAMAQQLVAAGQGNDTIRLGVEMNGSWATDNNDGSPTDFINAYNNAAEAMKAVPGANFSFDWNPSDGEQNNIPTEAYYPGNANVNSIGVDVYDWNESNPNATPAQTWNLLTTEAGGLNELAAFAQQQGKPFAIPEYAVSAPEGQAGNANATSPGMGDDPSFINNIANFLNTQQQSEGVAFQTYFDSASGGVGTTLETSPNSYNAYTTDFGNGGIDGAEQ